VNRAILYKQQIWSCQYTGKNKLTYEEALRYEQRQTSRHLFSQLPEHIVRHVCHLVHQSEFVKHNLLIHAIGRPNEQISQLVDRIDRFFFTNYVEGEEIFCELDNLYV
jgi:predicted HAD superfamily phosphohydrolase